jgi:hypothetical protein
LNIAQNEKAITEGLTSMISVRQRSQSDLDPNHQYAFLRKQGKNVIFVVANFENVEKEVRVKYSERSFFLFAD